MNVPSFDASWLLDSGASHHVINNLSNLSLHAPYDGTEKLLVGDGMGLHISHIGTMNLFNLQLNNVLVVPTMTKNIISISQLCKDNNISIHFSSTCFFLKDKLLLQGKTIQGVYVVKPTAPQVQAITKTTSMDWHHHLGHPSFHIFRQLISLQNLNVHFYFGL